jgi:tetratricopeptide (TPR) repeat protein
MKAILKKSAIMNDRFISVLFIFLFLTAACNKKEIIKHSRPEAKNLLKQGIEFYNHPKDKKIAYNYIDMLLKERHYAQALYLLETHFLSHFETDDQYYEYLYKAARGGGFLNKILKMQNHFDTSIRNWLLPQIDTIVVLNEMIRNNPGNKNLHYQRARAFYRIQEWEAAEYDFKQAGTEEQNVFEAFYNLIMIKFVNRKYKDALKEVNQYPSANIKPEEKEVLHNIKKVLTDIVNIEDKASMPVFQKHFEKAKILLAMKDYDLAVNEVNKAIALNESFGDAYALRAYILFQQRKFKPALSDIETAENITGKRGSGLSKMIRDSLEVHN